MLRATIFSTLCILTILTLCGCQQAAWKAGATADDFKRDEQICRAQTTDDAEVPQCLRDKGWSLANFDASTDDQNIPAANETNTAIIEGAHSPATDSTQTTADSNSPNSMNEANAVATKTERSTASTDPLQRKSVQTWWKAGAHAADFQIDADRCLTQLGEQHVPDYPKHLYTRGMIGCLRAQGWYAGSDPVYTPLR